MLRIAVIGAGHWGPNLIRNLHNDVTGRVAWVVDRDEKRLRAIAARYPGVKTSADALEAVTSDDVDAVVVATPPATHFEIASAALRAGKHVLVEKPITPRLDEALQLQALAEQQGRVLMVGHVFLFHQAVRRVKQYIDEGMFGRIYHISALRTNLGPIRPDVNAAWDLAAHDISIVNYWLGAEPLSASALGGTWINPGVEDAVFATLRYPGDVMVNMHVSWLNPRKVRHITVVGEKRMLTFDDMKMSEPLWLYDKGVAPGPADDQLVDTFAGYRSSVREGDITIPKVFLGEPLRAECDHFLECAAAGARPISDAAAGVAVVRALEAIQRSMAQQGKEEPLCR